MLCFLEKKMKKLKNLVLNQLTGGDTNFTTRAPYLTKKGAQEFGKEVIGNGLLIAGVSRLFSVDDKKNLAFVAAGLFVKMFIHDAIEYVYTAQEWPTGKE